MGVFMAKKMVSFRLPEDVLEMLNQLADMFGCSQGAIINALIRRLYQQESGNNLGTFYDILKMVK